MRNSPCIKSAADIKGRELLVTFWQGRSDWIGDSIHIVGPWTSFAISALVGLAKREKYETKSILRGEGTFLTLSPCRSINI